MEKNRDRAYRVVLSAGLLHLRWDLACLLRGFSWYNPPLALAQLRGARRAAQRAYAFHNLAISATREFDGFSEEEFWASIDQFNRDNADALCPYRDMFERNLRGERVDIIAPCGIGKSQAEA